MMLMLAVFSLGAYAQTQQGQSAVGFNIGYGFDSKNATLGVDYRYCITDAVRLSPSLTYFVKNDNHSTWAIEAWAADEFRSTNGQIQYILDQALRKAGRLKKKRILKSEEKNKE